MAWQSIDLGQLQRGYVNTAGTISGYVDGTLCTDHIAVVPGERLLYAFTIPAGLRRWSRCCWYRQDGTLLSVAYYVTSGATAEDRFEDAVLAAPDEAASIRLSACWLNGQGGEMFLSRESGGGVLR